MLKKILICLILFVLLAAGSVYGLLNSKKFWRFLVVKAVADRLPDAQVQSFDYMSRTLHFPSELSFTGVDLVLKKKEGAQSFHWEKLALRNHSGLFASDRKLEVVSEGLSIDAPPAGVKDIQEQVWINIKDGKVETITGQMSARAGDFSEYHVADITADIDGDAKEVRFRNFTAQAYGGKIAGEILLDYAGALAYSIRVEVSNIDLEKARSANDALFSQVQGKVNGKASAKGDLKGIIDIEGDLDIPAGGTIKAVWLQFAMDYIPQSTQKKDLELLIKKDGAIPVEKAALQLRSLSREKLSTAIAIKSAKLNLDVNLTVDINVEGGLTQLLKYGNVLSTK